MIEQLNYKMEGKAAAKPHERRKHVRHPFTAMAEAVELKSRTRVSGRTSDLSLGGCYVDTTSSFPAGTVMKMRITKEARTVELQAVVVYSLVDMGMGVKFTSADPEQLRIVQEWLGEPSREPVAEPESTQICDRSCSVDSQGGAEFEVLKEIVTELMKQGVLSSAKSEFMLQRLNRAGRAMPQVAAARVGVN
jgi:hypothetical protein